MIFWNSVYIYYLYFIILKYWSMNAQELVVMPTHYYFQLQLLFSQSGSDTYFFPSTELLSPS